MQARVPACTAGVIIYSLRQVAVQEFHSTDTVSVATINHTGLWHNVNARFWIYSQANISILHCCLAWTDCWIGFTLAVYRLTHRGLVPSADAISLCVAPFSFRLHACSLSCERNSLAASRSLSRIALRAWAALQLAILQMCLIGRPLSLSAHTFSASSGVYFASFTYSLLSVGVMSPLSCIRFSRLSIHPFSHSTLRALLSYGLS